MSASSISSQIIFSHVNVLCSFLLTITFEKPDLEIYILHIFTNENELFLDISLWTVLLNFFLWFLLQVQIRPWNLSDADFVMDGSQPLDPRKTIFVGGVPRPLRAGMFIYHS